MSCRSYRCVRYGVMFYRTFRIVRYRYRCCTDTGTNSGTDVHTGTGINFVPNLPTCPVPVLMSYRTFRRIRYRYWCRTELTEVSGTGIDVVPNFLKCPVPVLMLYRTYRSVRYRYESLYRYRSHVVPNLPKCPVPVIPAVCFGTYRTEHTLGTSYIFAVIGDVSKIFFPKL